MSSTKKPITIEATGNIRKADNRNMATNAPPDAIAPKLEISPTKGRVIVSGIAQLIKIVNAKKVAASRASVNPIERQKTDLNLRSVSWASASWKS